MNPRAMLYAITVCALLHFIWAECPPGREIDNYESKLHTDLFCAYEPYYRPVRDHRRAVNVSVRFALKYISFDALEETFTVHSWVAMKWTDEYLNWDPSNYGNVSELQVESHLIWTPRLSLHNADAMMYQSDQIYTTCLLEKSGNVTCVPHVPHSGICRTSLEYWPYDYQNCTLYFGSWMHTGEQINFIFFKKNPVVMNSYQDGPGWKLIRVFSDRLPGQFKSNVSFPLLKYTFMMKRESAGLAAITVIPSLVTVAVNMFSLLMDVKDNNRLALQCFSLFGHFVFLTNIGNAIPKHGATTPVLLLFIRDSMIVTFVSILLTLLLMSFRKRIQGVPQWLKALTTLVTSGPGRYVVFTEFDPTDPEDKKKLSDVEPDERAASVKADWMNLANLLNSVVFIIFVIVYVVLLSVYIPKDTQM